MQKSLGLPVMDLEEIKRQLQLISSSPGEPILTVHLNDGGNAVSGVVRASNAKALVLSTNAVENNGKKTIELSSIRCITSFSVIPQTH